MLLRPLVCSALGCRRKVDVSKHSFPSLHKCRHLSDFDHTYTRTYTQAEYHFSPATMEGRSMEMVKYSGSKPDTAEPESPPEQRRTLLPPRQPVPPPPPFHPGQWWFSNKIHTRLTPLQHSLLSTRPSPIPPPTQPNKCRKLRPWLILSLLPNNKALVICSTTRENRGPAGLTPAQAHSFLPIAPTPEFCGRAPVRVVLDERGVFVGRSLVFLEVVRAVCLGVLGEFIGGVGIEGEEAREGLQRVWEGRREWVEGNARHVNREQGGGEFRRGRGDRGNGRGRRSPRGRGSVSGGERQWRVDSRDDATTFQASADSPGRIYTSE
ncbi:hypothetical protein HOY82DRAFT_652018 [Tuber indicum]|nr:hypothetical protein HOY82DRAFT_652018 [Tuber indicum]